MAEKIKNYTVNISKTAKNDLKVFLYLPLYMLQDNIAFPPVREITINSSNNTVCGIYGHFCKIPKPFFQVLMDITTIRIRFAF